MWCFYLWEVLLAITLPLPMIIELRPPPNIHVILMKIFHSEQNLVTNILESIWLPLLVS